MSKEISPGKVRMYTFTPEQGHIPAVCKTVDDLLEAVKNHLEYLEVGDELFIKVDELSLQEMEDLPEHPGW